jgi:putative endonuclease
VTQPDLSPKAEAPAKPTPIQPIQPYQLYLLECTDGTLYTGVAMDVVERFIKHLLGLGAAYTRAHPPLRVLACRSYLSKSDALRAEYALKQLPRARKLGFFNRCERLAGVGLPALRK